MHKKRLLICIALLAALLVANLVMIQAASSSDLTFTLSSDGNSYIVSKCATTASGSLSIPATYSGKPVVEIGREAFLNCAQLTAVTIPTSVKTIGWYAFSGCTGLTSISIPDSVTTIDWFAFSGCTGLTSATIGNGVTCIDAAVFSGCTNLTNVTIGKNVTTIGWSAFKGCTNLGSINIPNTVATIDRYAFYGCSSLSSVTFCGTQEEWTAITKGDGNTALTGATLQLHNLVNGVCSICGHSDFIIGDIDGNKVVNHNDAIYLLLYSMFGEDMYPLNYAPGDIDGNGTINQDDAVYLLLHTMFGDTYYPIGTSN